MTDPTQQHSHRLGRGYAVWIAVLLLLMVAVVAVYVVNNRPAGVTSATPTPTPQMPDPNGWDDFVRAAEIVDKAKHPGPHSANRPMESWTIPEYEAFIADNAAALQALREGLSKSYLHPPVSDVAADFAVYAGFRETARTLAGEARYYEVIGQPGRAMDSALDCIEYGVILPRGGPLICALVGVAIETIGRVRVDVLLPKQTTQNLERIAARLERIREKRVAFADILRSEAALSETMLRAATGAKKGPWSFLSPGEAMIRGQRSYFERVAAEQTGVYTGKSRVSPPKVIDLAGMVERAHVVVARSEATLTLIQVEVALRRYNAAHGRYPARLGELKPDYLAEVPVDPFGGKELGYRVLNGGSEFVFYSIGPNLRDDRGKAFKWSGESTPGDLLLRQ